MNHEGMMADWKPRVSGMDYTARMNFSVLFMPFME